MNYKKALYVACLVVVILEVLFLKVMHLGHGYFEFEELPAFGALVGLLGTLFIIIVAKSLSKVVTKKEDYYD
ncbi:hypothetical protein [Thermodesulfovibrio sp. Kuro-1]|uniref:hypothetical protein n=1 Tax=Thermodesulfovibrio TaxID=28261 RepID=UPI0011421934|nr:hypothetical protein [Thermodesulfovibrio sp. Kuro-1]